MIRVPLRDNWIKYPIALDKVSDRRMSVNVLGSPNWQVRSRSADSAGRAPAGPEARQFPARSRVGTVLLAPGMRACPRGMPKARIGPQRPSPAEQCVISTRAHRGPGWAAHLHRMAATDAGRAAVLAAA